MKEVKRKISIPMYDSEIRVVFSSDIFTTVKRFIKSGALDSEGDVNRDNVGSAYFLFDDEKIGYYTIILPLKFDMDLLVHEISHCTATILRHHEIPFSSENDENFCILNGHIASKVYDKFKRV